MKKLLKTLGVVACCSTTAIVLFNNISLRSTINDLDQKLDESYVRIESLSEYKTLTEEKINRDTDIEWLALNIYHEARGETVEGMMAVGVVTLNRVRSSKYPDTIKEVVKQYKQFSWYWDGISDVPYDVTSWETSKAIAKILLINNNLKIKQKLRNVYHYHAKSVKPRWAKHMDKVEKIGNHIFYN